MKNGFDLLARLANQSKRETEKAEAGAKRQQEVMSPVQPARDAELLRMRRRADNGVMCFYQIKPVKLVAKMTKSARSQSVSPSRSAHSQPGVTDLFGPLILMQVWKST